MEMENKITPNKKKELDFSKEITFYLVKEGQESEIDANLSMTLSLNTPLKALRNSLFQKFGDDLFEKLSKIINIYFSFLKILVKQVFWDS